MTRCAGRGPGRGRMRIETRRGPILPLQSRPRTVSRGFRPRPFGGRRTCERTPSRAARAWEARAARGRVRARTRGADPQDRPRHDLRDRPQDLSARAPQAPDADPPRARVHRDGRLGRGRRDSFPRGGRSPGRALRPVRRLPALQARQREPLQPHKRRDHGLGRLRGLPADSSPCRRAQRLPAPARARSQPRRPPRAALLRRGGRRTPRLERARSRARDGGRPDRAPLRLAPQATGRPRGDRARQARGAPRGGPDPRGRSSLGPRRDRGPRCLRPRSGPRGPLHGRRVRRAP